MESSINNSISVEIPNYSGPLETLLDLDKNQKGRIEKHLAGYEKFYQSSSRIPKTEILKIEKESHLLLHIAWKGQQGIIASKIYENGFVYLFCLI